METYLEYNLKLQIEIIKEQRDTYKSELEIAREALANYKKLCQNQQATISELKNELFMVKNEMRYMDYTS